VSVQRTAFLSLSPRSKSCRLELIFLKGVDGLAGGFHGNTIVFEPVDIVDSSEKFPEAKKPFPSRLWGAGAVLCAICILFLAIAVNMFGSDDDAMRIVKSVASTSKSAQYDKLEPINPAAAGSPHAIAVDQPRLGALAVDPTETTQVSSGPQRERVKVASAANMRSGPSASAPIIGIAHAGAEAEVAARDSEWVQIIDPALSKAGWIHSKFLVPATVGTASTSRMTGEGGQAALPHEEVDASVGLPDENATLPTEPKPSVKSKKSRKHGWRNRHKRGLALRFKLRRLW
jgi:uncharacterized protein YraI